MIKLCSSTQISSVHYSLFRPPGLNTCISLVNRKEPLIWMNSGMNLGGRIASPQGTHSFFVVCASPWCAQNKISLLQCPPLSPSEALLSAQSAVVRGRACSWGWAGALVQLLHFCFQKLVSSPACMPWATAQDHLIAWARIWMANCHIWHRKRAILSLLQKNWNSVWLLSEVM